MPTIIRCIISLIRFIALINFFARKKEPDLVGLFSYACCLKGRQLIQIVRLNSIGLAAENIAAVPVKHVYMG